MLADGASIPSDDTAGTAVMARLWAHEAMRTCADHCSSPAERGHVTQTVVPTPRPLPLHADLRARFPLSVGHWEFVITPQCFHMMNRNHGCSQFWGHLRLLRCPHLGFEPPESSWTIVGTDTICAGQRGSPGSPGCGSGPGGAAVQRPAGCGATGTVPGGGGGGAGGVQCGAAGVPARQQQ